ncbi:suppressor of kinetochore protein mutant [Coemansia nantahalensis]|uniref:Suppressor of kinetochore protein mutant n=2 Tax=Coemansia TaxID=4863 RepID=A0ACC1L9N7_9FUNG|nr:suppressor of kinetochore protein mutant [Coemansia nantahalensis]KAJ2803210.1 suppressor of kinetochore protein mutant [Coemansia helicoidea]
MMNAIQLQASDGQLFAIDREAAALSSLVHNLACDVGIDSTPIPMPNVAGATLAKVVEYCTHHRDDVRLCKDVADLLQDDGLVEPWDRRFLAVDDDTLLRMLHAADYMGVDALVELCCVAIARLIRDLPADAIRSRFDITDDFSALERAQIAAEAALCD